MFVPWVLVFSFGGSSLKTLCCLLLVIWDCNNMRTGSGMIVLLFCFIHMVLDHCAFKSDGTRLLYVVGVTCQIIYMLTPFLFFLEGFGQPRLVFCDDIDVFCPCLLCILLLFGNFLINGQVSIWCFVFGLCFGQNLFWCNTFSRHYRPLTRVLLQT